MLLRIETEMNLRCSFSGHGKEVIDMPYTRPTLAVLQAGVASDIAASLNGADALLRFSNLNVTAKAQAGLANLHYGYLDWIAKQAVPFTCTDEFLVGWAALKNVYKKPAISASGSVTFNGINGTLIPAGSGIVRGDGIAGTSTADVVVTGGIAIVSMTINPDLTGLTGAFGNTAIGVAMTLSKSIDGVQAGGVVSVPLTGGADIESDDTFRSRMLFAYQNAPQGGSKTDYEAWAKNVPGVTRAWCSPNSYGAGTVIVYVMFDVSNAANNGFPQGLNGVATGEPRAVAATGDQLTVANYILPLQPVTPVVYVVSPVAAAVNFTISGIPAAKQTSVKAAIASVFFNTANATGGSTPIAFIWSAIASVAGVSDFVITSPAADIANAAGTLPSVGLITYT
jgi:uncharacterized phage protein gp47/JayE